MGFARALGQPGLGLSLALPLTSREILGGSFMSGLCFSICKMGP